MDKAKDINILFNLPNLYIVYVILDEYYLNEHKCVLKIKINFSNVNYTLRINRPRPQQIKHILFILTIFNCSINQIQIKFNNSIQC